MRVAKVKARVTVTELAANKSMPSIRPPDVSGRGKCSCPDNGRAHTVPVHWGLRTRRPFPLSHFPLLRKEDRHRANREQRVRARASGARRACSARVAAKPRCGSGRGGAVTVWSGVCLPTSLRTATGAGRRGRAAASARIDSRRLLVHVHVLNLAIEANVGVPERTKNFAFPRHPRRRATPRS